MITEYDLVWGRTPGSLKASVKAKLEDGWEPLGGVSVVLNGDGSRTFYQSLYKHTDYMSL